VRKAGNRIRVTAQLIAAADGTHLWSDRYERELADVFAIQDDIALAITSALQVKLAGRAAEHTPHPVTYEALLRGRHHRQRFTPEGIVRARECFRQAIALDPKYAAPHAELALTDFLATMNRGGNTLRETADVIRGEARLALELAPAESNSHAMLGGVAAALDYDWSSAAEHFRKAMSGSSVSADSRWAYACLYLLPLGRRREAMEEMRHAVDQDPLHVVWRAVLGNILNSLDMYDRALEELHKARELDENSATPHFILTETYLATGRIDEAVASAEKAYSLTPSNSMCWGLLAAALARSGQNDRASTLLRKHGESPSPVWGRVWYHLLRSEIDEAAHWYEVMIDQRESFAVMFPSYPVVAPLRENQHWPRLATMMNLPPVRTDVTL
jgi:tetratricopeptide (TPR) repeat protein